LNHSVNGLTNPPAKPCPNGTIGAWEVFMRFTIEKTEAVIIFYFAGSDQVVINRFSDGWELAPSDGTGHFPFFNERGE